MSLSSIELASALVSPKKHKVLVLEEEEEDDEEEEGYSHPGIDDAAVLHKSWNGEPDCSPTRVMDFPGNASPTSSSSTGPKAASSMMIPRQLLPELSITSIVASAEEVAASASAEDVSTTSTTTTTATDSSNPLDTPIPSFDTITPIPLPKPRETNFPLLPSVAEHVDDDDAPSDVDGQQFLSKTGEEQLQPSPDSRFLLKAPPLRKPKPHPGIPKPTRLERARNLATDAGAAAATGDSHRALQLWKRSHKVAQAELVKQSSPTAAYPTLKDKPQILASLHPATTASIHRRWQEDWMAAAQHVASMLVERCILLEREGEYEAAIEACREAKQLYKKQKRQVREGMAMEECRDIPWLAATPPIEKQLKTAGRLLVRLEKAQASYLERKQNLDDVLLLRQECLAQTSCPTKRTQLFELAEQQALAAYQAEQRALGAHHPQTADILHVLSSLMLDQGKKERGIQYLLQSYDVHRRALGPVHPRTGHDLLLLARATEDERSITYYQEAAGVFRQVEGGHVVVGSICNDVAVLWVAKGEFGAALQLLDEALKEFTAESSECEDEDSTTVSCETATRDVSLDVMQVWRNMGECHANLKQWDKAVGAFRMALEKQRAARRRQETAMEEASSSDLDSTASPGNQRLEALKLQMINDESIADTLRRLGRALTSQGSYDEALEVLEEATEMQRLEVLQAQTLASSGMTTHLACKQDQLAATLYNVAEVKVSMGELETATQTYKKALELRTASDDQRPPNQRCNGVHCAMCLVGMANIRIQQEKYVEAHTLFNNALILCEAQGTMLQTCLRALMYGICWQVFRLAIPLSK